MKNSFILTGRTFRSKPFTFHASVFISPLVEQKNALVCAPPRRVGTARRSKMHRKLKQVHPFGAGSQSAEAAQSGFMPYGFVTVGTPSRSAGKPGFVPTKLKRHLLCSPSSTAEPGPSWYHTMKWSGLLPLSIPEPLQRWAHFRQYPFSPGEGLLSSPSCAELSSLLMWQREEGTMAHLSDLCELHPTQTRQVWPEKA